MKDAAEAVEFALGAGLKVRGAAAREAARVSLAVHAARTVDARPFLARDKELAARACKALLEEGRPDLALQVALWEADGGEAPSFAGEGELRRALSAYEAAKAWAEGKGGEANLAWIRGVPRDPTLREALAQRLLVCAESGKGPRERLAAAALEAELAELPRPSSFATIFRAAAVARSPAVASRTLEGLGVLDPSAESPGSRQLFSRLRAAIEIEEAATEGRALEEVVAQQAAALRAPTAAILAPLSAHLAAACARAGRDGLALEVVEHARKAVEAAEPVPRDALAALLFVRGSLVGGEGADPIGLPPARRPTAGELTTGACEAARALRIATPALYAMRLFDPEDVGIVLPDQGPVHLVKELVREGAQAAATAGDLAGLEAIFARVRRMSLRPQWEIYLRALLADAAAETAARQPSDAAWGLALAIAGRGLPGFERAKMRGRAACEFVRALETVKPPRAWVDPYFPTSPSGAKVARGGETP